MMPDTRPEGPETFVDAVVPIQQRPGLDRHDPSGATLRVSRAWRGRRAATPRPGVLSA